MSTEKMKEQFAAWYLSEITQSYGEGVRAQAEKNLEWKREDGSFADPMLRLACLAWQASRESLVIELPEGLTLGEINTGGRPVEGHERWLTRPGAVKAIEAAGLKVQP